MFLGETEMLHRKPSRHPRGRNLTQKRNLRLDKSSIWILNSTVFIFSYVGWLQTSLSDTSSKYMDKTGWATLSQIWFLHYSLCNQSSSFSASYTGSAFVLSKWTWRREINSGWTRLREMMIKISSMTTKFTCLRTETWMDRMNYLRLKYYFQKSTLVVYKPSK